MYCEVKISKIVSDYAVSKGIEYIERSVARVSKQRNINASIAPDTLIINADGTITFTLYVGHHDQEVRDVDFISNFGKDVNNKISKQPVIRRISEWRFEK